MLDLDKKVNDKLQAQEQQSAKAIQQDEARENKSLEESTKLIQQEEARDKKLMEMFANTNKAQLQEMFANQLTALQERIDESVAKAVVEQGAKTSDVETGLWESKCQ